MSREIKLSLIFFSACLFMWYCNTYRFQAFCIPVPWALTLLLSSLAAFFLLPYIRPLWLQVVPVMLNGLFVWICTYCSYYMICNREFGILSIVFFGIGLWPLVFIVYSIRNIYHKHLMVKTLFMISLLIPAAVIMSVSAAYRLTAAQIRKTGTIPHNYWGERICGLHFKYGSRMCLYDGWRPPLHDPLLVIMLDMHGDPLQSVELPGRLQLYKRFFPDYPAHLQCTCNKSVDAGGYLDDPMFKP